VVITSRKQVRFKFYIQNIIEQKLKLHAY